MNPTDKIFPDIDFRIEPNLNARFYDIVANTNIKVQCEGRSYLWGVTEILRIGHKEIVASDLSYIDFMNTKMGPHLSKFLEICRFVREEAVLDEKMLGMTDVFGNKIYRLYEPITL